MNMTTRVRGPIARLGAIGLILSSASIVAISPARADEVDELRAEVKQLREEIAILRSVVQQNTQDVDQLAAKPKAPSRMVSSDNDNVSLKLSGQVNRMLLYADDGDQSNIFNADNDFSSTRIQLQGRAKLSDDLTVSAMVETEFESNSTDRVQIQQDRADNTNATFRERRLEVFADSASLGRLSIGQGSMASDGAAETILSGTSVVAGSKIEAYGGRILFLREDNHASSGRSIVNLFSNQDGVLDDRIRYDSPNFAGFVGSTSYADGDRWDAVLRYGNKFKFGEIQGAAGYFDTRSTGTPGSVVGGSTMMASVAYEAPFGTNIQGAYSEQDFEQRGRNSANYWWLMLGQDIDLIDLGQTAFSIAYAHSQDQAINGSSGDFWGIAAMQEIKKAATQIYFAFGQFDAELPGNPNVELEPITFAGLGARVKF
ncbi:MAG: porin [Alphaproteobacteria bacterium]